MTPAPGRRRRLTPILAGLLLVASACTPFAGDPPATPARPPAARSPIPAPTPGATDTAAPPPVLTPQPTTASDNLDPAAQHFTMPADEPATLDPALVSDRQGMAVVRQLYSGLVRLDDKLAVVPDLALAMPQVSADGLAYTFRLRPGLRWPDGGPLTAEDVRYSILRATDPALAAGGSAGDLPAALYLADIAGVPERLAGGAEPPGLQIAAGDILTVTLTEPRPAFLQKLTSFWVVDRRQVDGGGATWWRRPAGSGPFALRDWRAGEYIELVPNPAYYGKRPLLERITFDFAPGANTLTAYEQGLVDYVTLSPDDVERVRDPAHPLHLELQVLPGLSTSYLGFNLRRAPFDDAGVREAFSLAIDRDKIARVMFAGRAVAAAGVVPPSLPGYQPQLGAAQLDVTRARRLLAASPYREAAALPRIALYTGGSDLGPTLQAVLKQNLGVEVELRAQDWADYRAGLARQDFQMFILGWEADWPEPGNFLDALFRSDSPENLTGLADTELDSLLDGAAAIADPAARYARYAQAEARALAAVPLVPLLHDVHYVLLRPYLHNLKVTPIGILNLGDAYVDRER